jgi:hypothetical protein
VLAQFVPAALSGLQELQRSDAIIEVRFWTDSR